MVRTTSPFRALPLVALIASVGSLGSVGCGGAVVVESTSDASGDSRSESGGDGGCVTAVEGASCTSAESACMPPGDPCCIGYFWSCDSTSSTWRRLGLGCACMPDAGGSFACGGTTCTGGQLCASRASGIDAGGPSGYYSCEALPPACVATPTCDCVRAHVSPGWCTMSDCTVTPDGHVKISCMGV